MSSLGNASSSDASDWPASDPTTDPDREQHSVSGVPTLEAPPDLSDWLEAKVLFENCDDTELASESLRWKRLARGSSSLVEEAEGDRRFR